MSESLSQLVVHSVSKEFWNGGRRLLVLQDITYAFAKGASYAITGVSGSGKSTLLYLLGGLDVPTTGSVSYDSQSLVLYSRNEKTHFLNKTIGFVFQFHYLINELTVRDNILLVGMLTGLPRAACLARVHELLMMVGLVDRATAYPAQLSGGEQQRVSIARALFNKPAFLLADEPTGSLDSINTQRVVDIFIRARDEWGMGLIVCTHDEHVYQRMDYVLHLENGKMKL